MATATPQTRFEGPALEFDFPAMLVGVAEYEQGPTGLTLFYFPQGSVAAVDVRGGAAATINTDRLRQGYDRATVRAVFFAGGSSYGLEAASGIMAELLSRSGGAVTWATVPTVTGAVVFDFRGRNNAIHPDKALGRVALSSARTGYFPLGARGAGRLVYVGKFFGPKYMESAGQGGAFRQIGPTKLAVFSVVNSVGVMVDRQGRVVRGNHDPQSQVRSTLAADLADGSAARKKAAPAATPHQSGPEQEAGGNTTLTLLVTNQQLRYSQLSRLAVETHTSMARCIQPFHTEQDGDVLFAVTTQQLSNPELDFEELAAYASELAWDAVLSCVQPG